MNVARPVGENEEYGVSCCYVKMHECILRFVEVNLNTEQHYYFMLSDYQNFMTSASTR